MSSSRARDVQSLQALEGQVLQMQSRLGYMEEEKARLVAAAKGKNEQVKHTSDWPQDSSGHLSELTTAGTRVRMHNV